MSNAPFINCARCGGQTRYDASRLCYDCYREMKIDDYPPAMTAREMAIDAECERRERRDCPAAYVAR
jgi:NMD protein affecting ribosome stability and mRNA decay